MPSAVPSRVIVIGGGIVGLSSAWFLGRRGVAVTLLERDEIGVGASSGNAGILAEGHPPLPGPRLLRQVPRLLLDRTGPLYIAPRLDPGLPGWLWGFLRACRAGRSARSLAVIARLGRAAGACVREMLDTLEVDCEYRRSGWMEVFRTPAALEHGRETADTLCRSGYRVEELGPNDLLEREPAFLPGLAGALHYTDGGYANPRRLVTGLARGLADLGVELLLGEEAREIRLRGGRVEGVATERGRWIEGDGLVLAAGPWTSRLARSIGVRVPMQAGKGYHVNLRGIPALPSTTCVLAETFVAATPMDGGLRLAGTVELSGLNLRVNAERLDRLAAGARSYVAGVGSAEVESTWCGLRPMTADGLPVIGPAPGLEGVFVATGHAMMGFLLGPLTGKLVAESLLDGHPSLKIPELGADRF
jgi:D-amino-acid dehydrogenase